MTLVDCLIYLFAASMYAAMIAGILISVAVICYVVYKKGNV